LDLGLEV